jgi:hypothetical protein
MGMAVLSDLHAVAASGLPARRNGETIDGVPQGPLAVAGLDG